MKTYRKTYIEKVIECGTKNFDGKLIPADFDEKNLCTDCLDELLFNKNCVSNSSHTAYIGFVNDIISFSDITMMVVVEGNNNLHIHFLGMECITGKNLERLAEKVHEFFECVDLTVKLRTEQMSYDTYFPTVELFTYWRV